MGTVESIESRRAVPHFSGLPTDMDVNRLRERWPESKMKPGDRIPYREIEELIGIKYRENRWTSVTDRWRKAIAKDANIFLGCDSGVSFFVMTERQKVGLVETKNNMAARSIRKAVTVAGRVDRKGLDEEGRARLDFEIQKSAKMHASYQIKSKENLIPEMDG